MFYELFLSKGHTTIQMYRKYFFLFWKNWWFIKDSYQVYLKENNSDLLTTLLLFLWKLHRCTAIFFNFMKADTKRQFTTQNIVPNPTLITVSVLVWLEGQFSTLLTLSTRLAIQLTLFHLMSCKRKTNMNFIKLSSLVIPNMSESLEIIFSVQSYRIYCELQLIWESNCV